MKRECSCIYTSRPPKYLSHFADYPGRTVSAMTGDCYFCQTWSAWNQIQESTAAHLDFKDDQENYMFRCGTAPSVGFASEIGDEGLSNSQAAVDPAGPIGVSGLHNFRNSGFSGFVHSEVVTHTSREARFDLTLP